ncbi:MAG: EamA family transporter [Rhodospirillaceae bacterium]|jgi:inner membrane transporter RhtA|nr:EamA family transporter [Rhodospirillaceae bacterium]MBT6206011.1 EamA family transporter [Rhodospirillaceae bacterium]MBT6510970.1 EamA family transporter [Rhodospirillaceae bacterium]MBT7612598.1 EamA family transporter [Rhodospirillaceae bacterium]MBT7646291.1 EamA family transporter [Rhodospirillaceae bacterium]
MIGANTLERIPGPVLLFLAILSLQAGSAIAITIFPVFGPIGTMFLRMAFGALILIVIYRSDLVAALRQSPLAVLILGAIMTLQSAAFYEALDRIPLGIAVAIEFVGPLAVALVASRKPLDILFVLLTAGGIVLLTPLVSSDLDPVGLLWASVAGVGWASFVIVAKRLGRKLEGGVGLALAMSASAVLLFPFVGVQTLSILVGDVALLLPVFAVALLSGAMAFLFEFLTLKTMDMTSFGILVSIEPGIATLIGVVTLSESVDAYGWLAVGLITAASIGATLTRKPDS